jgi:hypothetical protein
VLVTTRVAVAVTVLLFCAGNAGGLFTSVTVTIKLFVALSGGVPLSVTRAVITFVLGPCASDGVHVITPEPDIAAPDGAASNV